MKHISSKRILSQKSNHHGSKQVGSQHHKGTLGCLWCMMLLEDLAQVGIRGGIHRSQVTCTDGDRSSKICYVPLGME